MFQKNNIFDQLKVMDLFYEYDILNCIEFCTRIVGKLFEGVHE